jgi:predicted TIM-barrel fold metal-dependent hydrolase
MAEMVPSGPVIDACVFHEWPRTTTLTRYMPRGYRSLLERPADPTGPMNIKSRPLYQDPRGAKDVGAYPASGPPGSDLDTLRAQVLDGTERERVVLSYDDGVLATSLPHHYIAREVARAANRWTAEEWLTRDSRLHGLIMISTALPEAAAAEIREAGRNERMVGVLLGANAMGKPFGHPVYHPIYAAAVEMRLPVVLQAGSDANADLFTAPAAGGPISSYGEYRALAAPVLEAHVTSLILQGVFEKFAALRLLIVGGGGAWIPAYLWRVDYLYNANSKEAPWLSKLPSEYFVEHVRVTTYGLEKPAAPERLIRALRTFPGLESTFLYSSGYPNRDWQQPDAGVAQLPEEWRPEAIRANAETFFRWEAREPTGAGLRGGAAGPEIPMAEAVTPLEER